MNWARNAFGSDNTITVTGGVANWARTAFGDGNTFTLTGGNVNTARNLFGSTNTFTLTGGYGNYARNLFGAATNSRQRPVIQTWSPISKATATPSRRQAGTYNGARNIVGDGNTLSAGGPGSNLNVALNGGGSDNTISAGAADAGPAA